MKIVTLLSGGQDSTTALFWAKRAWPEAEQHALTIRYGQRHDAEEGRAASAVAQLAGARQVVIESQLGGLVPSALTRDTELCVDGGPANLPTSFVPGRNLVFLSYAAALAGAIGAKKIVLGVSAVDYSGYPDCRPEFIIAAQETVRLALDGLPTPALVTPLVLLSKASTVRLARELGPACWEALGESWTCYDPQHAPLTGTVMPCGVCSACALRAKGFADAGEVDPWF